jgi:hypothetical protein
MIPKRWKVSWTWQTDQRCAILTSHSILKRNQMKLVSNTLCCSVSRGSLSKVTGVSCHYFSLSNLEHLDASALLEPAKYSLPYLKSFCVRGSKIPLKLFDLTNIEALDIGASELGYPWSRKRFNLASLPTKLTELTLNLLSLTIDSYPGCHPHSLPFLTTLTLHKVHLSLPLHECLESPKLQVLFLYKVTFSKSELIMPEKDEDLAIRLLEPFLRAIPELRTLSLDTLPIDNRLFVGLQTLPQLAEVAIRQQSLNGASLSLIERLMDEQLSPNLISFSMRFDVWGKGTLMSYKEFVGQCLTRRPKLTLYRSKYKGSHSTDEDT